MFTFSFIYCHSDGVNNPPQTSLGKTADAPVSLKTGGWKHFGSFLVSRKKKEELHRRLASKKLCSEHSAVLISQQSGVSDCWGLLEASD